MDTIFALSSGAPPAGIAVVRISGPGAFAAGRALAQSLPETRRAALRSLRAPGTGLVLDRALVLTFPGPGSATGEDLVELHLHGGRAVTAAVLGALAALDLREAEPGEFTRRALLHGRIDLSEAEGLGDLLMAETEAQRVAALRIAEGGLRRRVEQWEYELLMLSAAVEALLDHGDEGDVETHAVSLAELRARAHALAGEIAAVAAAPPVERLRDGVHVVLAGPPNAGKSTLLNALVGRDAAIVSSIAGTTRDRIEVPVSRDGIPFVLIDTAGLRSAADEIEAIGVERAEAAVDAADIVLWLGDGDGPAREHVIAIHPRADEAERVRAPVDRIAVSATTGEGLVDLWAQIDCEARKLLPRSDALALNRRQRRLCGEAQAALEPAGIEQDELLFAEHLRLARRTLARITGADEVEAVLDALFARFCIGK